MSVGVQGAFRLFHYDFKPRDQWILLIPVEFLWGQKNTGGCPTAIYGSQWWWHSACTYLVPGHVWWEHVWSPPENKEYPTATFISSALASAETSGGGWCCRHYSGCVGKPVWLKMRVFLLLCAAQHWGIWKSVVLWPLGSWNAQCRVVVEKTCLKLCEAYFYFNCVLITTG